jgi:hypothetical protein
MIIGGSELRRKWKSAQSGGKQGFASLYGLGTHSYNRSKADVAQLVEQSIRNALSLVYVVVDYEGLRVVLGGSSVSLGTFCTAFCTAT